MLKTPTLPSYLDAAHPGPWGMFLEQLDRVEPHLGDSRSGSTRSSAPSAS